jgi:hypothetical protein
MLDTQTITKLTLGYSNQPFDLQGHLVTGYSIIVVTVIVAALALLLREHVNATVNEPARNERADREARRQFFRRMRHRLNQIENEELPRLEQQLNDMNANPDHEFNNENIRAEEPVFDFGAADANIQEDFLPDNNPIQNDQEAVEALLNNADQQPDQQEPIEEPPAASLSEFYGLTGNVMTAVSTFFTVYATITLGMGLLIWIPALIGQLCIIAQRIILQNAFAFLRILEDPLMNQVRRILPASFSTLLDIDRQLLKTDALGTSPKLFSLILNLLPVRMLVGYLVLISITSQYLGHRTQESAYLTYFKLLANSLLNSARRTLKLAFFLTFELALFPFYCGILIDIFLLPFFQGRSISSIYAFHIENPFTSRFLHWMVGTLFMYLFALYIQTVRDYVRPGLLWFIRDPNDPEFQPFEDIMTKPMLNQIRKLFRGMMMYTCLIVIGFGGFVSSTIMSQTIFGLFVSPNGPALSIFRITPLKFGYEYNFLSNF